MAKRAGGGGAEETRNGSASEQFSPTLISPFPSAGPGAASESFWFCSPFVLKRQNLRGEKKK